ncbi:MAG: radical SAM protein [Armatimonadota bacterium]|nr:MAG: radical SAM protein [Armatimonadota bacterium]
MNVGRDWAGGFGTATSSRREIYGHDEDALACPYLPLLRVAGALERQHRTVRVIDAQAERLSDAQVVDRVIEVGARDVVASLSLPSLRGDLALLARIKRADPDLRLIAIGTVCKALPSEVLETGVVDIAVRGDAEAVVPELLEWRSGDGPPQVAGVSYAANGAAVHVGPARAIATAADLPPPAYHLAPMDRYVRQVDGRPMRFAPVATGLGCGFACGYYCPYPFGFGRRMLLREPHAVVEEVARLATDLGVEFVIFRDQLFSAERDHAELVCKGLIESGGPVRWLCETRADRVEPALLDLMRRAGCLAVHYGLESGDAEIFSRIAKPGATLDDMRRAVRETHRARLAAHLHVIVGLPNETWDSVRKTLHFVRDVRPDSVQVCLATPYPGTRMYADADERGLLLTRDWTRYTANDPVMRTEHMSGEDLARAAHYLRDNWWKQNLARRGLRRVARIVRSWATPSGAAGQRQPPGPSGGAFSA